MAATPYGYQSHKPGYKDALRCELPIHLKRLFNTEAS